jgi:Flp pilus assembly protein protease CpaA
LELFAKILCAVFLAFASFYDVKYHVKDGKGRIPNWLNLAALIFGLGLHAVSGDFWEAVSGTGWGLFFGMVFYALGLFGAGDVKMLAAAGALVGEDLTFLMLLCGLACLILWSVPVRLLQWGPRKLWEHEKQGLVFLAARIKIGPDPQKKLDLCRLPLAPFVFAGYCAALALQALEVIVL